MNEEVVSMAEYITAMSTMLHDNVEERAVHAMPFENYVELYFPNGYNTSDLERVLRAYREAAYTLCATLDPNPPQKSVPFKDFLKKI